MTLATLLAIAALSASIIVLTVHKQVVPIIAALTSGLQVAMAFDVVTFGIRGVSLPVIMGCILVGTGAVMWYQSHAKSAVSAATVVAMVGTIQVLAVMRVIH